MDQTLKINFAGTPKVIDTFPREFSAAGQGTGAVIKSTAVNPQEPGILRVEVTGAMTPQQALLAKTYG